MNACRKLLLATVLASFAANVLAGPLWERLAERRAAHAADESQEEDGRDAGHARLPAGVKLERNVAYGAAARQRFDVYIPANANNAPVIFMVHGGGWRTGDKHMRSVVESKVAHWATQGYIVISTNYRLLPEADPLTQAGDVAMALASAQEMAASWGADRGKFVLMGHSAGAHLVSLLASSPTLAGKAQFLGTVALDSAAYDVELIMQKRHPNLYDEAFGSDPATWRAASPYTVLSSAGKPLLAVCSSRRKDSCAQAERYAVKASGMGMRVQVLSQDLTHRDINQTLGEDGSYTEAVDAFLRSILGR
jgi:arylformamidase